MENMFIFGLFLGNPHLKNEKKSQSADNKQNFEILVPLRAKHLKPHNNRLVPPRVPENLNFADGICQTRTRKKG